MWGIVGAVGRSVSFNFMGIFYKFLDDFWWDEMGGWGDCFIVCYFWLM